MDPNEHPGAMERSKQLTVLLAVATAEFMTTFMVSGVNIALRAIDDEWHVSAVTLSWISLAYILTIAAVLMPSGRVADLYGRKRVFLIGMVAFTVLSFASALAPSASVLITLRTLQGIGTGMMYACTSAMVTLAYPPEQRGRALGVQVAGVYSGFTLGPLLGGVLIDHLGWRFLFVFVGVLGVVNCLVAGWRLQGVEWREGKTATFDVAGSLVWMAALTLLLIGLSRFPDALGWVLAAAGVLGIVGFVWWESRVPGPILNVGLFRKSRVFAYSNAATFICYAATYALSFLVSLYLEYNKGLTAQKAGLVLVTGTVVQAVFSPIAGRIADRVEARRVGSVGLAIVTLGLGMLAFLGSDTSFAYVVGTLCVFGLGFALFVTPLIHAIMGSVDRRYAGVASATIATMRMTGQNISMGIATLVLAVIVGRHPIEAADYPNLLTSIHLMFAMLAGICLIALAASLVGPRRTGAAAVSDAADS
jgi:EmrB/QacA subfamily drug resistance transporter